MTSKLTQMMAMTVVAMAMLGCAATSAVAQVRGDPGMSGCPDATKDGGVVAVQPIGGGGCDDAVYNDAGPPPGMRGGGKRSARPSPLSSEREPAANGPSRSRTRDRDR